MNSLRRSLALAVLLALAPAVATRAQTTVTGAPTTIDYQGKALDASGNPLATTTPTNYEMQFRIYDAQEGGSIIWSEKQIVTVSKGLFSVRLGEGTANGTEGSVAQNNLPEAFNAKERFLGVTIVITGQTPVEILPRLAFLATPFAYVANKAVSAERLILNPSTTATPSSVNLAQVSYATQTPTATITLTDQNHTVIVDAKEGTITVNLPGAITTRREYYIAKKDTTANFVLVSPPSGGTINGSSTTVSKLKIQGDSITIQNTGNNDWWIISDTLDKTPVGTIISSAGSSTAPKGYVACDFTAYSRTAEQFKDLFAAIGTAWGYPDAASFRVPDLRGMFLRGVDGDRNLDTSKNLRGISATGGNAGNTVGSYQQDTYTAHVHGVRVTGNTNGVPNHNHGSQNPGGQVANGYFGLIRMSDGSQDVTAGGGFDKTAGEVDIRTTVQGIPNDGAHSHSLDISVTTDSSGNSETRPKNVNVYYFIKY